MKHNRNDEALACIDLYNLDKWELQSESGNHKGISNGIQV
jgi:hypothetical protein